MACPTVPMRLAVLCGLLSLSRAALAQTSTAQAGVSLTHNDVYIDASNLPPPPETSYLHLGGVSSNGHTLQINSRYLVLDNKPWLPVMGELHYTRVPESEWEDEILKMKAGGINIISTYVFWIHHEEVEGQFDWSGRRDLRRFVQLCAKHGMYVWLRPGPWAHGEVRNGGFPDWINKLPNTRTNDPAYLHYVELFFNQIGLQLHGLMFKDGGPVIGTQLENEYGLHGPGRGAEHILTLKRLAVAAGIDPPLFSVTGWPSLDFPPQEVVPVSGGYPDGFWYASQKDLPPSITYLFNFNRELGDMGATVPSEDPTGKVNLAHDPYFGAEEAGGMATAYHRRPVLAADDIAALTLTGIGSGINLYGYYMFHGGTNPKGAFTTLQESQATGYPNDLPELNYDFQAPIGEFGQERAAYRKTRLMHLFLNAYGSDLAPMTAFAPLDHTRNPADTTRPRVAVRTNGTSGFVFVNNYVRQLPMPARLGFQVQIRLPAKTISVPSHPVDLPRDTYFAWPFRMPLDDITLNYSTAQLLTHLDTPTGKVIVFYAIPGIAPEFEFSDHNLSAIAAPTAKITHGHGTTTLTNITPGTRATIRLTDHNGSITTILLLSKDQAEQTTVLHVGKASYLARSASSLLFDGDTIRLRSISSPTEQLALLPDLRLEGFASKKNGLWNTYIFNQPQQQLTHSVTQTQSYTTRASMASGPYVDWRKTSVPEVPPNEAFVKAARWKIKWDSPHSTGVSNVLLQIRYTGDIARLKQKEILIDDNFFNGLAWQVGLKHLDPSIPLTLEILPMPSLAPIYIGASAGLTTRPPAGSNVLGVELLPEYESAAHLAP